MRAMLMHPTPVHLFDSMHVPTATGALCIMPLPLS
jgi:hypothetical protein